MSGQRMLELRSVTGQLAGDSSRILDWVQGLPTRVDQLVAAALDRDWREVERLSQQLETQQLAGCEGLRKQAAALRRALSEASDESLVKRMLVRLIFACGRIDPRNTDPRSIEPRNIEPRGPARAAARRPSSATQP